MLPPRRMSLPARGLIISAALALLVGAAPERSGPGTGLGKGVFLIAAEKLRDPNFAETVVLLLDYGPGGARGLVVNRRSRVKLATVIPELPELGKRDLHLYYGGPVELNELVFLVNSESAPPNSGPILPDVHLTANRSTVEGLLAQKEPRLRGYSGYAGWAPGQLDAEVGRGDWHVLKARASEVFAGKPQNVWQLLIDRATRRVARSPSGRASLAAG